MVSMKKEAQQAPEAYRNQPPDELWWLNSGLVSPKSLIPYHSPSWSINLWVLNSFPEIDFQSSTSSINTNNPEIYSESAAL